MPEGAHMNPKVALQWCALFAVLLVLFCVYLYFT